jgi:outer membrane protein assembly factor BamB
MNWIGVCFAIDTETGKLLWRTDKFTDLAGKAQNIVQSGISVPRYTITPVGKDRVLYTRIPLDRLNYGQEPYRLICVAADTGDIKWNSEKVSGLENFSFLGKPSLMNDGQTLYTFATQRGGGELNLMALDLETGKQSWSLPLGTPQAGNNRRGEPEYPEPVLIPYEGMLYVMTNNGAVICLRPDAKRIEWAATYPPARPLGEQQQVWWNGMPVQDKEIDTPGVALLRGGILYIKEARSDELYALDLAEKSVKWHRPVEPSDMLLGIEKHIYIVGNEISALDRASRGMLWSTKLPVETGTMRPLIAGDRAYVLTARGVFEINIDNGDVTHILRSVDQDSIGGALWLAGKRLVTVSNSAVTAYPLVQDENTKTAAK